jgi:hypothetical protein
MHAAIADPSRLNLYFVETRACINYQVVARSRPERDADGKARIKIGGQDYAFAFVAELIFVHTFSLSLGAYSIAAGDKVNS